MTKISTKKPPAHIYDKCVAKWGVDFNKGIVFTYGDTIHSKDPIPKDLMVHELVHVRQHRDYPGGKDMWWERYLEDDQFRYDQEIEAYRKQYQWILNNVKDREVIFKHLMHYAQCLSGEMYGKIITLKKAMDEIKLSTPTNK